MPTYIRLTDYKSSDEKEQEFLIMKIDISHFKSYSLRMKEKVSNGN